MFSVYNILLLVFPIRKENIYSNQERAEEFIYSREVYAKVFVGSGLIGDFKIKQVWKDSFNLFLPYSGSCAGVEIISLSKKVPRVLFVETNYIFKGFNQELTTQLFNPFLYHARFFLPSLLRKHWPKSFMKELMKVANQRRKSGMKRFDSLDQMTIDQFKILYDELPESISFEKDLEKFQKYIDIISSKGCRVVFFEMPVDKELVNSRLAIYQRSKLKSLFPEQQYSWVATDLFGKYHTSDGIHLNEASADQYFNYLRKNCNYLIPGDQSSLKSETTMTFTT